MLTHAVQSGEGNILGRGEEQQSAYLGEIGWVTGIPGRSLCPGILRCRAGAERADKYYVSPGGWFIRWHSVVHYRRDLPACMHDRTSGRQRELSMKRSPACNRPLAQVVKAAGVTTVRSQIFVDR